MARLPLVSPRILVLEGLYADTADIISDCGGIGIEASPWNMDAVVTKLKSGNIDGLLLTGGGDVNPAHYGEPISAITQAPDHTRDATELYALRYARAHKIPVLGICRGSQIMCVSMGGKLVQDIHLYSDAWMVHNGVSHDVYPTNSSRTFSRFCLDAPLSAISLHHQCVAYPGRGMRIAATAPDGTPEAIESKDGLMLGVQFHPEMTAYKDEQAFAIFRWLVETAARRRGGRAQAVNFRDACDDYYERLTKSWQQYTYDDDSVSTTITTLGYEDSPASTQASNPGLPARTSSPRRKAGDAAIPSMRTHSTREMVQLIESTTGQSVMVTDENGVVIDSTCEDMDDDYDRCEQPFDCDLAKAAMIAAETGRDPRLPGKELVRIQEDVLNRHIEISLRTCPTCHIMFDLIEDCDDHKKYVHPQGSRALNERYPDMQPPPGDPAWEDVTDEVAQLTRELGFTPEDVKSIW